MKIVDIHTHGIGGYDTRTTREEDILRIAEMHGSAGVLAIIPAIYPDTIEVMRGNMLAVKRAMERDRVRGDKAAAIIGVHLEGPFLNPVRCGALNRMAFIEPTEYHLDKLLDGFEDIVKIITIAPEMGGATRLIRKISDQGIVVSMGHSDATYLEAEAGFHAGARGITHLFNAMRGIHHREPGIAGFGLLNDNVYVEVIGDPHHLHVKTLTLIFRTKGPDRIILVSDSVKETNPSFNKGGAGEFEEKTPGIADPSGRLQGGCMTITESSRRLKGFGFNEEVVEECISKNPAKYLSL